LLAPGGARDHSKTLREREQRFHELLEALPAAIYTTDANGKITYFNQAAVDLWGGAPADVTVDYDTAGLRARIVVPLPH
jgi:PAS domain-containing protein